MEDYNIERFVEEQDKVFSVVKQELREGKKRSHWMWYIFPQIKGLGRTPTSKFYSISCIEEVKAYLDHPKLKDRLRELCQILIQSGKEDPVDIFGNIDARKLKSSMTLFDIVSPNDIFSEVLDKFFCSKRCGRTLSILDEVI